MVADSLKHFHVLDYVVFVSTLLASLGIGILHCCTGGRQRTTEEYVLGNRQMSLFPVTMSMIVSSVSAITIQGLPAEVYQYGLHYAYVVVSELFASLIVAFIFTQLFYPLPITSLFEYFELRFHSSSTRMVAAFLSTLTGLIFMSIVIFGPSVALESVVGIPTWWSIIIITVFSTFYSAIGGIKAVIWADTLQSFIMIASVAAVIIVACLKVGGVVNTWNFLNEGQRLNFFKFNPDPRQRTNIYTLTICYIPQWTSIYIQQVTIQRMKSLSSQRKAQWAMLFSGFGISCLMGLSAVVGGVLYAYYHSTGCDPYSAGYITNINQILPYFVVDVLSFPGFPGLFVACLFSASLSSLSSTQNSLATILWEDFLKLKLYFLKETRKTLVVKAAVVMYGFLSLGFAFTLTILDLSLIQIANVFLSSPYGSILGMVILGAGFTFTTGLATMIAALVALVLCLWIGIGRIFSDNCWEPALPVVTDKCQKFVLSNSSAFAFNSSSSTVGYDLIPTSLLPTEVTYSLSNCPVRLWLYSLSPDMMCFLGLCTTVILGLILSVCQNMLSKEKHSEVPPCYLFPFLRKIRQFNHEKYSITMQNEKTLLDKENCKNFGLELSRTDATTPLQNQSDNKM